MHQVDIHLGNTGDAIAQEFEVYFEKLKDGVYVASEPMRKASSEEPPIKLFLEPDERVVIVAKDQKRKVVFDKVQNANVTVEDEPAKPPEPVKPIIPPPPGFAQSEGSTAPRPVVTPPPPKPATAPKDLAQSSATQAPLSSKQVKP